MTTMKVLQNQAGIQFQGVKDKSEANPSNALIGALITGQFLRGRFDKPFKVTKENIRAKLGYDPQNPDYVAIEDALTDGAPFIYVQRVVNDASPSGACTLSVELVHDSFIPDNGQQYGVWLYSEEDGDYMPELYPDSYEFVEGRYIDLGALMTSIRYDVYGISNSTQYNELPHSDLSLGCKIFDMNYPIRLRKASGTWNNLPAGSVVIKDKGQTYSFNYESKYFSTTGGLYTFMIDLYDQIRVKLESIGLSASLLPDTTFENSTSTSFNASYFPRLDIRSPEGDLSTFSIEIQHTDSNTLDKWLLDGYKQQNDCLQQYSINDFPGEMTTTFTSLVPGSKIYPEDEYIAELVDLRNSPIKFKLKAGSLPNGRINLLDLVKNHEGDIDFSYCWTRPYVEPT